MYIFLIQIGHNTGYLSLKMEDAISFSDKLSVSVYFKKHSHTPRFTFFQAKDISNTKLIVFLLKSGFI